MVIVLPPSNSTKSVTTQFSWHQILTDNRLIAQSTIQNSIIPFLYGYQIGSKNLYISYKSTGVQYTNHYVVVVVVELLDIFMLYSKLPWRRFKAGSSANHLGASVFFVFSLGKFRKTGSDSATILRNSASLSSCAWRSSSVSSLSVARRFLQLVFSGSVLSWFAGIGGSLFCCLRMSKQVLSGLLLLSVSVVCCCWCLCMSKQVLSGLFSDGSRSKGAAAGSEAPLTELKRPRSISPSPHGCC